MRGPATMVQRLLALVGKELVEVLRRPGALVSLILGPFLILAIFGLGYDGQRRPLETVVVIPPGTGLPTDVKTYQDMAGGELHIASVAEDRSAAFSGLLEGRADIVVVAPANAEDQFRAGYQSVVEVLVDTVDPIEARYAELLAADLSNAVNQAIIRRAAQEGEGYAVAGGRPDISRIPPDVVAAPTRSEVLNLAPSPPTVLGFYGPAVLALILQHLAVTLIALSLVRDRTSGVLELFRVAPVNAWEILTGKVVAYLVIGGFIGVATVVLLVAGFHVPLLGDPAMLTAAIGMILLASLGLGLTIAVISDSERQAVQLSLLVLLASVFFSGFVLALSEFNAPVRALAYVLPVTSGIRLLQDIMLRGTFETWPFVVLAIIALVTLTAGWLGLRHGMARA